MAQLLLCVEQAKPHMPQLKVGSTYTYEGSMPCFNRPSKTMTMVAELAGYWYYSRRFIPLNDPNFKDEDVGELNKQPDKVTDPVR